MGKLQDQFLKVFLSLLSYLLVTMLLGSSTDLALCPFVGAGLLLNRMRPSSAAIPTPKQLVGTVKFPDWGLCVYNWFSSYIFVAIAVIMRTDFTHIFLQAFTGLPTKQHRHSRTPEADTTIIIKGELVCYR